MAGKQKLALSNQLVCVWVVPSTDLKENEIMQTFYSLYFFTGLKTFFSVLIDPLRVKTL
jgi:hypothetical protein